MNTTTTTTTTTTSQHQLTARDQAGLNLKGDFWPKLFKHLPASDAQKLEHRLQREITGSHTDSEINAELKSFFQREVSLPGIFHDTVQAFKVCLLSSSKKVQKLALKGLTSFLLQHTVCLPRTLATLIDTLRGGNASNRATVAVMESLVILLKHPYVAPFESFIRVTLTRINKVTIFKDSEHHYVEGYLKKHGVTQANPSVPTMKFESALLIFSKEHCWYPENSDEYACVADYLASPGFLKTKDYQDFLKLFVVDAVGLSQFKAITKFLAKDPRVPDRVLLDLYNCALEATPEISLEEGRIPSALWNTWALDSEAPFSRLRTILGFLLQRGIVSILDKHSSPKNEMLTSCASLYCAWNTPEILSPDLQFRFFKQAVKIVKSGETIFQEQAARVLHVLSDSACFHAGEGLQLLVSVIDDLFESAITEVLSSDAKEDEDPSALRFLPLLLKRPLVAKGLAPECYYRWAQYAVKAFGSENHTINGFTDFVAAVVKHSERSLSDPDFFHLVNVLMRISACPWDIRKYSVVFATVVASDPNFRDAKAIVPLFEKLKSDEEYLHRVCLEAVAKNKKLLTGNPTLFESLARAALAMEDWQARRNLFYNFFPLLIDNLDTEDSESYQSVIDALVSLAHRNSDSELFLRKMVECLVASILIGQPKRIETLTPLFNSINPSIRRTAFDCIGDKRFLSAEINKKELTQIRGLETALAKAATSDPDEYVRAAAANALLVLCETRNPESGVYVHPYFKVLYDNFFSRACTWGSELLQLEPIFKHRDYRFSNFFESFQRVRQENRQAISDNLLSFAIHRSVLSVDEIDEVCRYVLNGGVQNSRIGMVLYSLTSKELIRDPECTVVDQLLDVLATEGNVKLRGVAAEALGEILSAQSTSESVIQKIGPPLVDYVFASDEVIENLARKLVMRLGEFNTDSERFDDYVYATLMKETGQYGSVALPQRILSRAPLRILSRAFENRNSPSEVSAYVLMAERKDLTPDLVKVFASALMVRKQKGAAIRLVDNYYDILDAQTIAVLYRTLLEVERYRPFPNNDVSEREIKPRIQKLVNHPNFPVDQFPITLTSEEHRCALIRRPGYLSADSGLADLRMKLTPLRLDAENQFKYEFVYVLAHPEKEEEAAEVIESCLERLPQSQVNLAAIIKHPHFSKLATTEKLANALIRAYSSNETGFLHLSGSLPSNQIAAFQKTFLEREDCHRYIEGCLSALWGKISKANDSWDTLRTPVLVALYARFIAQAPLDKETFLRVFTQYAQYHRDKRNESRSPIRYAFPGDLILSKNFNNYGGLEVLFQLLQNTYRSYYREAFHFVLNLLLEEEKLADKDLPYVVGEIKAEDTFSYGETPPYLDGFCLRLLKMNSDSIDSGVVIERLVYSAYKGSLGETGLRALEEAWNRSDLKDFRGIIFGAITHLAKQKDEGGAKERLIEKSKELLLRITQIESSAEKIAAITSDFYV